MKHKRLLAPILIAVLLLASFGVATAQIGRGWFQVDSLKADGNLLVEGISTLVGAVTVGDDLTVTDDLSVSGATTLGSALALTGNLTVTGDISTTGTVAAANDMTVGDDLTVTDNADVVGNLEVTEYMLTQSWLYMIPPAAVTVTDGMVLTPTASVMELTAAGAVGAELVAAGDGQLLMLVNTGAQTITISDTATIESTGDVALGQYDTLTLVGVGVKWYEVAASNN